MSVYHSSMAGPRPARGRASSESNSHRAHLDGRITQSHTHMNLTHTITHSDRVMLLHALTHTAHTRTGGPSGSTPRAPMMQRAAATRSSASVSEVQWADDHALPLSGFLQLRSQVGLWVLVRCLRGCPGGCYRDHLCQSWSGRLLQPCSPVL